MKNPHELDLTIFLLPKVFPNEDDKEQDPTVFCKDTSCNIVDCLENTTTWFNGRYPYDAISGPNSNTFVYSAMAMCLTKISLPPNAYGGQNFPR